MKITFALTIGLLTASLLSATETNQVQNSISKLKEQSSYSWVTKAELPGMPFTPEPQHGKIGKESIALVDQEFNGEAMLAAFSTNKVAVQVDGQWQAVANPNSGDFGDRAAMTARFLARSGTAATEAEKLLGLVKELKAGENGLWSGELTEKGAAGFLTFGPRNGGPGPKNAKGTAKFWLKDGALSKFQTHATGTVVMFDQEERDIDLTRTVEIQDVGKTKVEIPEGAKKILAAGGPTP
jgi:hypothetical protein